MKEYGEIIKELDELAKRGTRYERGDWDRFVKAFGLSYDFPFVHVSGTNGKEVVATYLAHIYREASYKCALFTKKILVSPKEMIEINGEFIKEADFARIFNENASTIASYDISYFEIMTFIAIRYFHEQKVDLAIIATGLGGEFDATNLNLSSPILSIITEISLDHTFQLGTSESEIAKNESAIIKEKSSALLGKSEETVSDVIRIECQKKQSEFHLVDDYHFERYVAPYYLFSYVPYDNLSILSPAQYMIKYAALALEAVKILRLSFPVSENAIRKGLSSYCLPCHLERARNVYLDNANNPAGISDLVGSLSSIAEGRPIHVLFAAVKDKNIAVMLPLLGREATDITLTTFPHPQAKDEIDYFLYEGDYPFNEDYRAALNGLIRNFPDDVILVTGSSIFASLVRAYLLAGSGHE